MQKVLLPFRYVVFGLFIICNAIICAGAVWNLSLAQSAGVNLSVDDFLIFTGAFGLTFIFSLIFIELLRENPVTARVWFECIWIGIFFLFDFSGAVALSVIAPSQMCSAAMSARVQHACTSTHLVLAFTWILTLALLAYFIMLVTAAVIQQKDIPQVWHATVRAFPWHGTSELKDTSPEPAQQPRFRAGLAPLILAPQARQALPPIFAQHARPDLESNISSRSERPMPPSEAPSRRIYEATRHANVPQAGPSLYPQYVQNAMAYPSAPDARPPPPPAKPQSSDVSQQPLGDWPRTNAASMPLRSKKQRTPPPPLNFNNAAMAQHRPAVSVDTGVPQAQTRPTLPRTRTRSNESVKYRPPPLDLSKISSFKTHS